MFKNLPNNVVRAISNSETESFRVLSQAHILYMNTSETEVVFYYCALFEPFLYFHCFILILNVPCLEISRLRCEFQICTLSTSRI